MILSHPILDTPLRKVTEGSGDTASERVALSTYVCYDATCLFTWQPRDDTPKNHAFAHVVQYGNGCLVCLDARSGFHLVSHQSMHWTKIRSQSTKHSVVVDSIKYCWETIVAQGLPEASGEARKNMISFHKSTDDHFLLFLQLLVPQLLHHSAQNAVSLIYLTAFRHLHLSIMWVYMTGEKNTWIEESDWCARCSAQCNAFWSSVTRPFRHSPQRGMARLYSYPCLYAGLGSITNWQLQLQYQLQAKHNYHLQLQLHQGGFQLCN